MIFNLSSNWSVRKRALVLTLVSLFMWEAWEGVRVFPNPWGDLKRGTYTDHFSHMNAARVFPRVGLDIWRFPIAHMFPELSFEELQGMPKDIQAGGSPTGGVFAVQGWPEGKPLATSWSGKPRLYPPGDMLAVAPVALLYHYTNISFETANRLLLMLFIFYAHIALYLFFEIIFSYKIATRTFRLLCYTTVFIVYVEVIHWTLEGFYDALVLAPLILCSRALIAKRGLVAVTLFCIASVLHFRTFFWAPWFLYGMYLIISCRQWRSWRVSQYIMLAVAILFGSVSLSVFLLLWPTLQNLPVHNHICILGSPKFHLSMLLMFLIIAYFLGKMLWRLRAYLDVAVLIWITFMIVMLREAYPWHIILAVIPWICAPLNVGMENERARLSVIRLIFLASSICFAFSYEPFAIWKLWPL